MYRRLSSARALVRAAAGLGIMAARSHSAGRGAAMRAAFYEGARRFTIADVPIPTPSADEALRRVKRVGICGTDLHIFQGHLDHRVPKD